MTLDTWGVEAAGRYISNYPEGQLGYLLHFSISKLLGKTLRLGKTEGKKRRGQQRMGGWVSSPTQWT